MVNDFVMWVFNLIDYFAIHLQGLFENISELLDQGAYYMQQFEVIMSYIYFFIPKFHLNLILTVVVVYTLGRILFAIANLIWP